MLRVPVSFDLSCQISSSQEGCKSLPAHCIIKRGSKKVALVWLETMCIEKGYDLLEYEKEMVLSVISENQYELEEAYRKVANGW